MGKKFYVTTAIDYVNGHPHLGHAYEKVITDAISRAHAGLGEEVFYLTGLDEHGQKVEQAATAAGQPPQTYCDGLAATWEAFTHKLELTNNDFVRTTQPRHKALVSAVLSKLHAEGQFYLADYHGFYSTRQETFLTDRDRLEDGSFPAEFGDVVEITEKNYYFRLKEHQQWLVDHIEAHPDFIYPKYRRNEVLGFLRSNSLEDLCITRPANRLSWGIPLPWDPDFVTYVWFDALLNYITVPAALGDPVLREALNLDWEVPGEPVSLWPADIQVIGKDILKFHAVYWPIMLKAMNLPLPRQVMVHGWWQKNGEKIAKSTGNIVDPVAVIDEWGIDAFRYYVLRELDIGPDGNWTDSGFEARYSAELANSLGNLVNRSLSMIQRYREGRVPAPAGDLKEAADQAVQETGKAISENRLQAALVAIWGLVSRANQYVDETAPFRLAKDPDQAKRLDEVLYCLAETCRHLAVLITPFLPGTSAKLAAQLKLEGNLPSIPNLKWGDLQEGHLLDKPVPLFPRKDLEPRKG